jgi:hypothetical protein
LHVWKKFASTAFSLSPHVAHVFIPIGLKLLQSFMSLIVAKLQNPAGARFDW